LFLLSFIPFYLSGLSSSSSFISFSHISRSFFSLSFHRLSLSRGPSVLRCFLSLSIYFFLPLSE
jgi:hypothetical protein